MPRRLLVSLAFLMGLVGLLLVPVGGAAADPAAISPSNVSTPIPGATNGKLPAADLIAVAPGCLAARAAAPSLGLLLRTAREQNVVLGTEECYRSLAGQIAEQQIWTGLGNSACAASVPVGPSGPVGTSIHGWGKAVDLSDAGGTVSFGSPGYRFLKANAGRLGWNHPGWAEPGGSACPEAWHWEWVGDGGTLHAPPVRADVVGLLPSADGGGYSTVTGLGALNNRGDAPALGDALGGAPQLARGRRGAQPGRLLAGGFRRRGVHLRHGTVLRVHRCGASEPADCGDGGDAERAGVLVGGVGWRGVHVWRCRVLWVRRVRCV